MPPFSMSADKSKDFKKSIKYLFKAFKPYRWAVAVALTISMLGTVLSIIGPLLLNRMMELLLAENGIDFPLLTKLGIALVAMYVVSFTFTYLEGFIMAKVSAKIAEKIKVLPINAEKYFKGFLIISKINIKFDQLFCHDHWHTNHDVYDKLGAYTVFTY